MRILFYGLTLLLLALPAYAQGPQSLFFPQTTQQTGGISGRYQNFSAGPGQVSITGGSNNGTDQLSNVNVNGVLNVKAFGAYGDLQIIENNNCSLPANNNLLTCAGSPFTAADVGKTIFVPNFVTVPVTGAVNNGAGLIRLSVNSTGFNVANKVVVTGIASTSNPANPSGGFDPNTFEANGSWNFLNIGTTAIDLVGSTFVHAYTSGGTVSNTISPTLDTIITGYIAPNAVSIGATRAQNTVNQNIAWGHDDTVAMQNAYNAPGAVLYFPPGSYLNRGQNWTQAGYPKGKIYSDIGWGGANIWSINVTDPGGTPGASKVAFQHTGYVDTIDGLGFFGGFHGAPDTAPDVVFLSARIQPATGFAFDIDHSFDNDVFETDGIDKIGLMLYGSEQTHFQNIFAQDIYSSIGILYFSACNTAGIVGPYGALVAPPTSMTFVALDGKKNVVAGGNAGAQNGGGFIVLDETCDPFAVYNYDLNKIYTNQFNSIFLRDTYTGVSTASQLRNIRLRGFYGEPQNNSSDQAVNFRAMCGNCTMEGQWYTGYGLNGITPWEFGLGFVDSMTDIDTTGEAYAPAHAFHANTCAGSYLNLGIQAPNLAGCTDWLYNNGWNWPGASMNGPQVNYNAAAVEHLSAYGNSPTVSSGGLQQTGSDSIGKIVNATAPITLTFHRSWGTTFPACQLTDDGQPSVWFTSAQGPNSVVFNCVNAGTGAACTGLHDVSYMCPGQLPSQ